MTTTFIVMRKSFDRWRIIGVVLLALLVAGCATLRLTYGQGPHLMYWWLDRYVDVDDSQAPRVHAAIARWFAWHRATQLPDYAALLERLQPLVLESTTPAAVCAIADDVRRRGDVALEHGLPDLAAFARTLRPAQIRHLEQRFAKVNREFRDEHLQSDRDERLRERVKRAQERAERLYGPLERPQHDLLVRLAAASPFDGELWEAERHAQQRDLVQTLNELRASPQMPSGQAQALLHEFALRLQHSPRPIYRRYQERLRDYNCELVAALHNATTPAQRRRARERLAGWEADLARLAGGE
jgi:hypothetical protein